MRRMLCVIVLAACEAKSPPAPTPVAEQTRVVPARRTKPRTETRPTTPPRLARTADVWAAAERAPSAEAWEAAADAYEAELDACTDGCLDAAYAVVLARKNALLAAPEEPPPGDEPVPVPPRVQAAVDAMDAYVALAEPDDPDVAGLKFLASNALYRFRQPDSILRMEEILRDHRGDPVAEYAANTLLDLLLRSGRVDDAKRWVAELLGDAAFLADKPALRETLDRLQAMFSRR